MDSPHTQPALVSPRSSVWDHWLGCLRTIFWSGCSMAASLQPRDGLFSFLPFWGRVTISKRMEPVSEGRETYLARVRWLWRMQDATLQYIGSSSAQETLSIVRHVNAVLKLKHPNIQVIFGTCDLKVDTFLVAQYFKTSLLAHLLSSPTIDRRPHVLQVVDALRFLHEHGLIHGDLRGGNVFVSSAGRPIITAFASPSTDTTSLTAGPPFPWEIEKDEEEAAPPDDSDIPYERLFEPRPGGPGPDPLEVTMDGVVDDLTKSQALSRLRSTDIHGDIFALGFLIVQCFTNLGPEESPSALRILRMALKGQRPPHPGYEPQLRGLDQKYWYICLRCWDTSLSARPSAKEIFDVLSQAFEDAIRPPFEWSTEELDDWVKNNILNLTAVVRDIHEVKVGRDAEVCGPQNIRKQEVQGTWVKRGKTSLVKIILPEFCRRRTLRHEEEFLAEAFMWAQLRHENVLPLLGIIHYNHTECFVVPWMAGGTAMDWARTNRQAPRLPILIQVADALHWLHTRAPPIIHGCIRARSVWVAEDGHAYLGNFDFQKVHDPERGFDAGGLDAGMRWSAPELAVAENTTRTDVFGYAMFAYEMLSLRKPFHNMEEYSSAIFDGYIAGQRPKRPKTDEADPALWGLVKQCWAHNPRDRPSMGTVARRLREIQASRQAV